MKSIVVRLLPLLLIYVVIVAFFSPQELLGDESRYLGYAKNITLGFYTDRENPELENGPIYPLLLAPFVYFDAPLMSMKMLNPILSFFGVLYFYALLRLYLDGKLALLVAYLVGVYPLVIQFMPRVYCESLTFFLASGAYFHFCNGFKKNSRVWFQFVLAAIFLALLILTKVLFAYVIVVCFLLLIVKFLFFKNPEKSLRTGGLCIAAITLCIPYLIYTYSLTGKVFLWGTGGGAILYWKTSPFSDEFGNWHRFNSIATNIDIRCQDPEAMEHHLAINEELQSLSYIKRDEWLRERAIDNLKNYPERYAINTVASFGRLLFSYPYSYTAQKLSTYYYMLPNMFLFASSVFCAIVGLLRYRLIPWEMRALLAFSVIYIGGICLLNGIPRHLLPVFPVIILLNAFVITRILSLRMRNQLDVLEPDS